ncbi:MAG: hypothetical protein ACPG06_03565 [Alphaproteobacteria bacterium]
MSDETSKKPPSGMDSPSFGNKIAWIVGLICAGLVVGDFLYHKHGHFEIENVPVFYGLYGFVAFIFVVFVGVGLRKILMRDEDYYDRD